MTEYDECQVCVGWCCISFGLICKLTDPEIERIADYLEIPVDDFESEYVHHSKILDAKTFRYTRPCRFWTAGLCAIHKVKPDACAGYSPLHIHEVIQEPLTCSQYHKGEATKPTV